MKPTKNDIFRSEVSAICTAGHMNKGDLAKRIGLSASSLYRKLSEPEMFTLFEIRNLRVIAKGLGIEVQLQ